MTLGSKRWSGLFRSRRCRRGGYTYLYVLFLVLMMGLASTVATRQWRTELRREREAELLFRGDQLRQAIGLYYLTARAGVNLFPRSIDDLLKDPNSSVTRRYLRERYKDPITGKDFELVKEGGFIKGVRSSSMATPIKQGNFPKGYEEFATKTSYHDWVFKYTPQGVTGVVIK